MNVPEGIRTPDPRLRRPLLYPAELRTHTKQTTIILSKMIPHVKEKIRNFSINSDCFYHRRKSYSKLPVCQVLHKDSESVLEQSVKPDNCRI